MSDCSHPEVEHIFIEGVGSIVVREPSADEDRQRKEDAAVADSLHTPEELQGGMFHDRADVRWRVVDRLVARGAEHPKTVPSLLAVLQHDPSPAVRDSVAMGLWHFVDNPAVRVALERCAQDDSDEDVRRAAEISLGAYS